MPNVKQQLTTPAVPDLPNPQERYDRLSFAQTNAVTRNFFLKLTNLFSALLGTRGAQYINAPYGAFQDGTDQTAANTNTAYAITFDTTYLANGVTLSNSSRLNVSQAGVYNVQFSIQFKNTTNDTQDTDVWFRKNGTDIPKSNSRFGLAPRKASTDPSHIIGALNFFVDLAANDYLQIMWRVSDTGVSIEHYAAGTSPTRPAIPSVIATVSFVSNIY
jgi:hypothetical protein